MTTAARPAPGPEVVHADAMDILSDAGCDMANADLDFDLGSANGQQHQEDDALALQDAGLDGGVDVQDDFMVDKDDLIEEDEEEIDYSDLEQNIGGEHRSNADNVGELDDDLIDYSDLENHQEEEYEHDLQNIPELEEEAPAASGHVAEEMFGQSGEPSTREDHAYEHEYRGEDAEGADDTAQQDWDEATVTKWEQPASYDEQHPVHTQSGHSDDDHQEDTALDGQNNAEHNHTEQNVAIEEQHQAGHGQYQTKAIGEQDPESDQGRPLPPVTINYNESEFWLFKPRDTDEGEWLLEDESVAIQNFPYLFHACRAQLGDDISVDTELGFRFDNFHALELFEDCTACAYTTFKELADIYLGLHAQDGHTNPESFYVTLRFRPRALSLVNELKKAFQGRIGFSGFNSAVASGKSSFNNAFPDNAAGSFHEGWEVEDQKQDGEVDYDEQKDGDEVTYIKEQTLEAKRTEVHSGHASVAGDDAAEAEPHDEHDTSKTTSMNSNSGDASAPGSHGEKLEDDLIDYSDEEEEAAEAAGSGQSLANEPSSDSATVQGDDASYDNVGVEDATNPAEPYEDDNSHEGLEENYDTQSLNELAQYDDGHQAGNDAHEDGQEFDQAYEQGFEIEQFSGQDFKQDEDGFYYDNDDSASYDQQGDFGLTTAAGGGDALNAPANTAQDAEENGLDDFLDLTGTSGNDAVDDALAPPDDNFEDFNYNDEEDAIAVGPSGAEVPAVASLAGLDDQGSPQGQKRPIDEVDVGSDGDSDTSDAKRPKL